MKYVQPNSAYPNLSASYGGSSSGAMSLKEQQKRDEMRNHGHLANNMNMLNSGQGPDNGTFYNYLQYKMNHKNATDQVGVPQIPLNPVHQKSQSQAPKGG